MTDKVECIQTAALRCECAFGPGWDRQSAAVDNPAGHNLAAEGTDPEDRLAAYIPAESLRLAEQPCPAESLDVPSNIAGSGTAA